MKTLSRIVRTGLRFGFPIFLLLAASVAQAQFTYTTNNGTITITRYTGSANSVSVPAAIDGLPVTGIAEFAFSYGYYGWNLTHLIIPDTVTNVSELALYDCAGLSTISVDPLNPGYSSADGVLFNHEQTILVQYPGGRTGSYTIPNSVTAIGKWAFNWCLNLTEITVPAGVTNIGVSAFTACGSLANITVDAMNPVYSTLDGVLFSKDLTTLMYYPKNRNGGYAVPDSVTRIADEAFEGHSKLGEVTMGDSVTNIGMNAFYSCEQLTNVVFGDGVVTIGDQAFLGCRNLTNVSMGNSVTSLGQGVFWSCTSLQSLVLPDSVTSIGSYAFVKCSSLTNLVFGSSVSNIEQFALSRCNNLTTMEIPNSVRSIGAYAFEYCSSLTKITLGNSITNIGDGAFEYCNALTSLAIPTNVARIGDWAFYACRSVTNVTLPASLTNIGNSAFRDCSSLTTISVDALNTVYRSLDGVVFNTDRTTLMLCPEGRAGSYVVPNTVTAIRSNAFQNCTKLTSITMLENVVVIGDAAFSGCRKLTNVVVGKNTANIGHRAFENCSLTAVAIPASVTNFGASVFAYCYGLWRVYWSGNALAVPSSAFYNTGATIYYLPGNTGWGATFAGRPTALWKPRILTGDGNFGVRTNQFGFNISWASGMTVAVDASTDLATPVWTSLQTNTLASDTLYFGDPQWTNYPARFYRLRWP